MLREISTSGFRNLQDSVWRPNPGAQLVSGPNGAGKTSLLEAIYVVSTTRSFRTPLVAECLRHGAAGGSVRAEVGGERRSTLEVAWRGGRRRRTVNGRATPLVEHLEPLPVVAWSDAQAKLLEGPPTERRRFLDRGSIAERPAAMSRLTRYRHALAAKRRLLLRGAAAAELAAWNRVLATAATELIALRAAYTARLEEALVAVLATDGLELPAITLSYRPSPPAGTEGSEAVEEALASAAPREREAARPLVGPHRDELVMLRGERPARRLLSAGEQKLLTLALVAAQARLLRQLGRSPVYLLDDLDSELDPQRLEAVWRVFRPAGQVVATSSRPQLWSQLGLDTRWRCESGALAPDPR